MEISSTSIEQIDKNKPRNKCRKWKLVAFYYIGNKRYRKSRRITGSLTDAKIELDKFLNELENDNYKENIKFADYSDQWLQYRIKSNSFSPNTLRNNKDTLKRLNGIFSDYYLTQLTPSIIKNGLIDIPITTNGEIKQASNSYKRKLHKTMKCVLKTAILDGYLETNPMENIPIPKNDTKERTALDKDQFNYLLSVLNNRPLNGFNVALQLICYLGLRRAEVVALTWDNYNESKKTISITNALKEKSNTIGEPKSPASKRTIPLNDNVNNLLKKWKYEISKYPLDNDFICCNNVGRIMRPQTLWRYWRNTILKNNNTNYRDNNIGQPLPIISLHDLRHTNLTLVSRYMSPFDLQHYAGWSDLGPAKIYIHKDQEMMRKALQNANL